jgi:hypothetical protein
VVLAVPAAPPPTLGAILPDLDLGPPLPWPGYTPPPKPKVADVLAAAERERELHEPRVQQGYEMLRRYNLDPALRGYFTRDRKGIIDGEIETFPDPAIRNETDAIVSFVAQMDRSIEAIHRLSIERDEAQAKEDAAAYILENQQRQYGREGGSLLSAAKAFCLVVFGMVAEFHGIDVDNDEVGLRFRLLDPNVVYPIWEGPRGLGQVYMKYETNAARAIGTFGNHPKFKESVVRKSAGGASAFDPNFMGTVVEYWDRHWCMVCWQDEAVLTFAHAYNRVPFNITPGNFGQPANVTAPHLMRYPDGTFWTDDRKEDYKRLYQPFLWREVPLHEIKEALVGRLVTDARDARDPARVLYAGVLTFDDDTVIDTRAKAINKLRDDDKLEEITNTPDPSILQPLWATITAAEATSRPSSLMAGNAPMSQGSGTALNVLGRAGLEKWSLPVLTLEQHETNGLEMDFALWRDFGAALGMEGDRGVLYVPRSRPNPVTGDAAAHEVTPELLRRVGIRVKVALHRFNPEDLPMLAQGVGMLKNVNLIPDRQAIRVLGYTTDVEGAIAEIRRDMLEQTPVMQMLHTLNGIIEEMQQAAWREDFESFEQKLAELEFVAGQYEIQQFTQEAQLMQTRMLRQQMQRQQMQMQGGMGMGMGPSMNGMTGYMGLPTGTQGGSPMGQRGPQQNPQAMPGMAQIGAGY